MQTRTWMVVAAVLALVLVGGGICVCGTLGYLVASAPDDQIEDERAQREGTAAGASGTTEGCVVAAHDRMLLCGTIDIVCAQAAQDFVRACLRSVPSPDRTVCDGVPAPSAMGDWSFADQLCQSHGWASDAGECDPIADGLSIYCYGE